MSRYGVKVFDMGRGLGKIDLNLNLVSSLKPQNLICPTCGQITWHTNVSRITIGTIHTSEDDILICVKCRHETPVNQFTDARGIEITDGSRDGGSSFGSYQTAYDLIDWSK